MSINYRARSFIVSADIKDFLLKLVNYYIVNNIPAFKTTRFYQNCDWIKFNPLPTVLV